LPSSFKNQTIKTKIKGVTMKKLITLVAVLLSTIVPIQSVSANQKSLVIIDSYFDSKVNGPNITCITLENKSCTDIVTSKSSSLSHDINHGNAMAEVAKKQNPNLSIVLLRSAEVNARSVSAVNAGNFIDALRWVDANSSTVGAVSFSRYFNGRSGCSPATANTAGIYGGVVKADQTIRDLIVTLKSKGIQVFVSTGNNKGTKIDYPACIADTVSVSSGALNKSGAIVSNYAWDLNTDFFANYNVLSYKSPVFGFIPQTTSSATVAVASQYLSGVTLTKVVSVNP
jgi:hypothetical protein